jgi:hypothetical protein
MSGPFDEKMEDMWEAENWDRDTCVHIISLFR